MQGWRQPQNNGRDKDQASLQDDSSWSDGPHPLCPGGCHHCCPPHHCHHFSQLSLLLSGSGGAMLALLAVVELKVL